MTSLCIRSTALAAAAVAAALLPSLASAQSTPILAGQTLTVVRNDASGFANPPVSATVVQGGPAEFNFFYTIGSSLFVNPDNGVLKFDFFSLGNGGGGTGGGIAERYDFILPATLRWVSVTETADTFGAFQAGGTGTGWNVLALNPATPQVASLSLGNMNWQNNQSATASFSVLVAPVAPIPEPHAALLGALGLAGLAGFTRARRRRAG